MRHIFQRYQSDCVPTCIAIIADISYHEAMRLVHPFHIKRQGYSARADIRGSKVLRSLGFRVRKRYIKDFTKLKDAAILSIIHRDGKHVVVWDPLRKRILDPGPNLYREKHPHSWYKKRINYALIITRPNEY
jgi:ABC-type bacteriocin/lantibiotic exporter with double-glycine peptidase domain